ncbi:protein-L-isoaspartate(D-aspartate) O-methyltransferase [Halomonas halocynthiae]|uniref:protein-L-isoaspartate(D-aspartate) O-methyltransferase n=1 Tax=Halomonas halocynthiae TaxID=176290 RepID=UPI000413EC1D|nr:protein-L-isoaspartate(D-aspartate) O-methyltransferase [Halomonas halocynthiae]
MHSPESLAARLRGIGMTSQRTRDRMADRLAQQGIKSTDVIDVMVREPRHLFLDEALAHRAYEDTALPIGHGQTLSQPFIVARMTELVLALKPEKVLEIGTGSGYQTLILSRLVSQLWSVERINPLYQRAAERLRLLKVHNIHLKLADGGLGWPDAAPFDVILLTACAETLEQRLLEQLADGGVLIAPLKQSSGTQWLVRVQRNGEKFETKRLEPVRFVPLLEGVIT